MAGSRRGGRQRRGPEIGIAPLVDLVFLLLIFFLLSSALAREEALRVDRPRAVTSRTVSATPLVVNITAAGTIHLGGKRVPLALLEEEMRRSLASRKERRVLVAADTDARAGRVVRVMDTCRLAGAGEVMLATKRPGREGD